MELRLLGSLELLGPSGEVPLGGPKERSLLAYLALHRDSVETDGALIAALWDDEPPRTARRTLQAYISRLRSVLAAVDPVGDKLALESRPGGWRLEVGDGVLDLQRVEELVASAESARAGGDHVGAALTLARAEHCWRGAALAEFDEVPWARAAAARLAEQRLHVVEQRLAAEMACGRHGALVGELEALCAEHPLRERLWGLLMVALYRSGRQAEALRAYQGLRRLLGEEVGLDPSPALAQIEARMLRQDHELDRLDVEWWDLAQPVPAGQPPEPDHVPPGLSQHLAGFVGRAGELDALTDVWERARLGALQVALIAGEPGIGKTALAAQHAARAAGDGALVLFGRCDETNLVPFQPFVEAFASYASTTPPALLRRQLGAVARDIALLVPGLGSHLPEVADVVPTGAETERYRLFEAVPAFLRSIGSARPILLLIDDLHWADQPTLQLLQHLSRRGSDTPALIIGTYRDTDLGRAHPLAQVMVDLRRAAGITRIAIRGLSLADVTAMVTAGGAAEPVDGALADTLWNETDGSPLFLREILRHLAETGAIARDERGRWRSQQRVDQLGIPEGVREVIGRRLARLSDDANVVLNAGSVLGGELRLDVLVDVTGLTDEQVLGAMEEAGAAQIVEEVPRRVDRWTFTHSIIRQVLHDELSTTRRVRLHQRIAEALERSLDAADPTLLAEIAHHYGQSAVAGNADKAIAFARRAAEHARATLAFEDAANLLAGALEVAEDAGSAATDRADLLIDQGDCWWRPGDRQRARAAFEQAVALVPDDGARVARIALGYAGAGTTPLWSIIGVPDAEAIALLERALHSIGDGDSLLRARLLACLAQELHYVRDSRERRTVLSDEALALARRLGDEPTLAYVLDATTLALFDPDTAEERVARATEAAAIAEGLADWQLVANAEVHRAMALAELDQIDASRAAFERGFGLLEDLKHPLGPIFSRAVAAGRAVQEGRFADAELLAQETFELGQESRDPNAFMMCMGGLICLRCMRGDLGSFGDIQLEDSARAFAGVADSVRAMFIAIMVEQGRRDAARARLDALELSSLPRAEMWLVATFFVARAAAMLGSWSKADELYELLLSLEGHNAVLAGIGIGSVDEALGLCALAMGEPDRAVGHLEAAVAAFERNDWRAPRAEASLSLGEALARRGRPGDVDRAHEVLDGASLLAVEIGMPRVQREAAALRAALDGREPPPQPAPSPASRRDRVRSTLVSRGRDAARRWTEGMSDDEVVRWFGAPTAQRALFAAMAALYRSQSAEGLSADVVFELEPPPGARDAARSDLWTVELRGRKARARQGASPRADCTVRAPVADFVRMASGEIPALTMIVDGRVRIDGQVNLALELPKLVGLIDAPA